MSWVSFVCVVCACVLACGGGRCICSLLPTKYVDLKKLKCFEDAYRSPGTSRLDPSLPVPCLSGPPRTQPAEMRCALSLESSIVRPTALPSFPRRPVQRKEQPAEMSSRLFPEVHCQAQGSACLPEEFFQHQEQPANTRHIKMAKGQHKNTISKSQGNIAPPEPSYYSKP